jgi:hypothetical protein
MRKNTEGCLIMISKEEAYMVLRMKLEKLYVRIHYIMREM